MFLKDQIRFWRFMKKVTQLLSSTKLLWILTTGFRREDRQSFYFPDGPCPLAAMILTDQICLAIFVEGPLVTISAKLFSILTIGFKGEDLKKSCYHDKPRPLVAMLFKFLLAIYVAGHVRIIRKKCG